MWLSEAAVQRIRELELRLQASVPRADHESALARIADLERRCDWQCDMLLRRGQSMPLPPVKGEPPPEQPTINRISESDIAKAEAIRAEGVRLGAQGDEIEAAVRRATGWSYEEIAKAVRESSEQ
jgi:hypothetical protein